jgi:hypothetical protein
MNSPSSTVGSVAAASKHRLGDAAHERHVATDPHLHVHRADPRRVEGRHVDELVRHDGAP